MRQSSDALPCTAGLSSVCSGATNNTDLIKQPPGRCSNDHKVLLLDAELPTPSCGGIVFPSAFPSFLPPDPLQDLIQQHHYEGANGVLTPSTTLPCGPDSLKPHGPRYM